MVQYEVGPDELGETFDENVYVWVIAWYEQGDYEGSGLAAALRKDGIVEYANLGHCSCCGPVDSWDDCTKVVLKEFLTYGEFDDNVAGKKRTPQDYDFGTWQAVVAKARETEEGKAALAEAVG